MPAPVAAVTGEPPPIAAAATDVIDEKAPAPRPLQPVSVAKTLFRALLSREAVEALQRARDLASHRIKPGDWDALIGEMARVFCEHEEKRFAARTDHPRQQRRTPKHNDDIPAAVRRTVWKRDGGRCAYVGPNGHRCDSRFRVQYHHVLPAGQGGPPTVDNISLRCARHNQHEADLVYGKEFMDGKRKGTIPGNSAMDHTGDSGGEDPAPTS